MKLKPKILLILFLLTSWTTILVGQTAQQKVVNADSSIQKKVTPAVKEIEEPNYQSQITELNKQIISLTQTVASTKESFYNSNIYLWTFIITALGLIIVVVGIFGYKSISDKISELKSDTEKSVLRNESTVKEIKEDLVQRIVDIKSDIKEFKADQVKVFEKFDKDAIERIDKGLDSSLQKAIEKIMKESFRQELNDLSEQVADLSTKYENLISKQQVPIVEEPKPEGNNFEGEVKEKTETKSNNNAFDEQH